jgi:hypothetical protein
MIGNWLFYAIACGKNEEKQQELPKLLSIFMRRHVRLAAYSLVCTSVMQVRFVIGCEMETPAGSCPIDTKLHAGNFACSPSKHAFATAGPPSAPISHHTGAILIFILPVFLSSKTFIFWHTCLYLHMT